MDIQEITIESHIDFKKIRSIKICLVDLIDNTLSYAGVCTCVNTFDFVFKFMRGCPHRKYSYIRKTSRLQYYGLAKYNNIK